MAASASSSLNPNPTTPVFDSGAEWIAAYLTIHEMSDPSYRYAYLLWIAIVFGFLVFALLHWTGTRGGSIGAYWSKWAIRRRTWRKKHALAVARRRGDPHKQPLSLPSNAQILCLALLFLASVALCSLGPDYIAPSVKLWDFTDGDATAVWRRAEPSNLNLDAFDPNFTIHKEWWTAGNRTGLLAFALFPLCVLFALKSPPFALFAIPFMIQLFYDKLYGLHRWCGRIIWVIAAFHVAFWGVQLAKDRNAGTGQVAWVYVWDFPRFIFGCVAFVLLTLLVTLSWRPIRSAHYEFFYATHVFLVPATLITSGLHHPQVGEWCWAALALWCGERLWRGTWWLHINGFLGGMHVVSPQSSPSDVPSTQSTRYGDPKALRGSREAWEMNGLRSPNQMERGAEINFGPPVRSPLNPEGSRPYSGAMNLAGITKPISAQSGHGFDLSRSFGVSHQPYIPPPGYAHAELLSGRTVRLRLISPGLVSWAPGQHFLVSIPFISKFSTHPFTVASVCDEEGPDETRQLIFIIRCKSGWTKQLWDSIIQLTGRGSHCPPSEERAVHSLLPQKGVIFRALVDGPFGSSVRARWGAHSTAVIVVGGAGVSFGVSVLEYLCTCMIGRDGKSLGGRPGGWGMSGFNMRRVRFIWLVREFAHIQWSACSIQRCLEMIPSPGLQVDIYVTNFKPDPERSIAPLTPRVHVTSALEGGDDLFVPPTPRFAQDPHRRNQHRGRSDSIDSDIDRAESDVDLSYYFGAQRQSATGVDWSSELGHETDILDLTNFDGDNDAAILGEAQLNRKVKKEGKLRRAQTRRVASQGQRHAVQNSWNPQVDETGAGAVSASYPTIPGRRKRPSSSLSTDQLLPGALQPPSEDSHQIATLHSPGSELDITSPLAIAPSDYRLESLGRLDSPSALGRGRQPPRLNIPDQPSLPTIYSPDNISPVPPSFRASSARLSTMSSNTMVGTESIHELLPHAGAGGVEVRLEPDEHDILAINIVAEHARPGKPRLHSILAEEVEDSQGSIIVACCGPTSLNAVMRKVISQQIDPLRIRRGDLRGSIALVSEEFHF